MMFQFGFGFGAFDSGKSFFQKHRISLRVFSNSIIDRSDFQPYIIFAYSGYCQLCFRLEHVWQSVVEDLEPLGYGIATVNAMTDGNLLERLRVTHLPSVVVVVEGRTVHYRESMNPLSAKSLRLFARSVIPNTFLLKIVNHDGLRRFIDQWKSTNKISVLIFGAKEDPRMRYMLVAMKYSTFARFAYVYLNENSEEIRKMRFALSINCLQCENVLIFNDFPEKGPVARLSVGNGSQISVDTMSALIESHKHLVLPRLASQAHLDDLCPVSSRMARRLCVMLTVIDSSNDELHVKTMREFVGRESMKFTQKRVQFVYIFVDRQRQFILPFLERVPSADNAKNSRRDVIVVWRMEQDHARFAWLQAIWDGSNEESNHSGEELRERLDEILSGSVKLDHLTVLNALTDEFRPSLFVRMSRAAVRMSETMWFHLTKEEALPVLSAVGTFLVILLIGYGLNYASAIEEKTHKLNKERRKNFKPNHVDETKQWHPEDPRNPLQSNNTSRVPSLRQKRIMREMEPLMHELRAESYFGMIRLLKPGCRSIVILVDEQSKDLLLPQFADHVFSLRNNKTFSFGYLMIDKNLAWFRKLLEHTLPIEKIDRNDESGTKAEATPSSMYARLNSINPRQTLGTVLVLCGWKLYFSIYHPMHTSSRRKNFLGFDDDGEEKSSGDSSDDNAKARTDNPRKRVLRLKLEDVLNGFPNWLDRLLEGSIRRYYIPDWPDNLK
ncbi:hypothetical protein AB6A40_005851 [Gnathostoma spinigerum]|uniref:Thioredoxin domain-containing protein n=1 Tax=Gnathostoma spinigerum TaxID=75299 RepID=A0ABD6ER29_9BILA